ncbi:universal stress protein [Thermodesulfatator atlanticus]|uniref:universal stress protein n=1 Tax=Thermodesulfatator atlanticus TaxID=501497 RepID=UPI000410389E|nr:universal stress protein [Thermodesulfatator atlanticus]
MAYKHLLVPIDGSDIGFKAIEQAADLAKQYNAKMTILFVIPKGGEFVDLFNIKTVTKAFEEEAKKFFEKARKITTEKNISPSFRIAEGKPYEKIIEVAKLLGCDLIIMGSHGRGSIEKFFIGSCTERVLKEAPCPVLVVRD